MDNRTAHARNRNLIAYALKSKTDRCIEWQGALNEWGYGRYTHGGSDYRAHRFVLIQVTGHVPIDQDGNPLSAAHAPGVCHNRACINPRHLRWASHSENMLDRQLDGTSNFADGSDNPASKLTADKVREIRASTATNTELALRYGVSPSVISRVRTRKLWKHVA